MITVAIGIIAVPRGSFAADATGKTIAVRGAWITTPPSGAKTAAGYFSVSNLGREADRLLEAASPLAAKVDIHSMSMTGGVMRMRAVTGGLDIGAGKTVRFNPAGYHLMFIEPKRSFGTGDRVPVTLTFARGGAVRVQFPVQPAAPVSSSASPHPSIMASPERPGRR